MSTHGYTNDTVLLGGALVRKSYRGSDAAARQHTELACLGGLANHLPVPVVAAVADRVTEMQRLPGRHGQGLIDDGHGYDVLHAVGVLLRRLQALPLDLVQPPLSGSGEVLVHGDYGAQNMLFDDRCQVTALLDWEFAHRGDAIEDLAWAEWIVRMHHPRHVEATSELFAGYGERPPWRDRQTFMTQRCRQLRDRCLSQGLSEAADTWASRSRTTAAWREWA